MSVTSSQSASADPPPSAVPGDQFAPPWIFRNGHIQTLAGTYVFGRWTGNRLLRTNISSIGEVSLIDGDRLTFLDDCPANWQPGDRVAVLLHGLAGSCTSPYMPRIARRLNKHGVRTIRVNWRGCGNGIALARYPYHSGRSDDLLSVIQQTQTRCPNSPIYLVGFSMGGNIVLKLLGELGSNAVSLGITRAVAVCPPIHLSFTVDSLRTGLASLYDKYFARACIRDVRHRKKLRPDAVIPEGWFSNLPKTMREFDATFTAPVCGFASADDYYMRSSAMQFLPAITVPTLMFATQDDPVIPFKQFAEADISSSIQLLATRHGGHMGFVNSRGSGWLDRQISDWVTLGT